MFFTAYANLHNDNNSWHHTTYMAAMIDLSMKIHISLQAPHAHNSHITR